MLLSYSISGWLLLNLCIMSHRGNHLSILYDKIPVFYALKYPKFTTITFYPSAWRPNPLLTLPNCTTSSWPHAHFNDIFTHVTISDTNMKVSRVKQPIKRRFKVKIADIICYMWRHDFLCNKEMLKNPKNDETS